jgi:hypothetical protein
VSTRRHILAVVCVSTAFIFEMPKLRAEDKPQTGAESSANSTAPAGPQAEKYQLTFKFRPNQVLRYEVLSETEISTKARDEIEIQRNSTKTKRHHRVAAIDEKSGDADLELSIDWVSMRAIWDKRDGTTPVPIEFQSDDPNKQPGKFKHILASVGKPWATIRFQPTGSPLKVVMTAVQSAEPKGLVTDTGADGALEAYLIVLPEHPVAVGQSWTEKKFDVIALDEHRNRNLIAIQRVYKLTEVKAGRATIELKTMILSPVTNPAIASQLLLREVGGKITFDVERGLILSKEWTVQNTVVNPIPGVTSLMKGSYRYSEKLTAEEQAPERVVKGGADTTSKK